MRKVLTSLHSSFSELNFIVLPKYTMKVLLSLVCLYKSRLSLYYFLDTSCCWTLAVVLLPSHYLPLIPIHAHILRISLLMTRFRMDALLLVVVLVVRFYLHEKRRKSNAICNQRNVIIARQARAKKTVCERLKNRDVGSWSVKWATFTCLHMAKQFSYLK